MTLAAENTSLPLSRLLKESTASIHEELDRRIMVLKPFSSRQRYACFLRVQLRLHHVSAPLYRQPELRSWLPVLEDYNRLDAVRADCADFDIPIVALQYDRLSAETVRITEKTEALGWLYTYEGSTQGAAFLLKYARERLGLSETFGARHLAAHPEGRALHWRRFKRELDIIDLAPDDRKLAVSGAQAAFAFVQQAVEELLAPGNPVTEA